jgi:membrane protein involved in colicin uptake
VGGLGPWVKATEVQGRLVLADEPDLSRLNQNVSQRVAEHQRLLAEAEAARLAAEQAEKDRIAAEKAAREAEKQAEKDRKAAEKAAARAAEEAAAQAERDRKAAEAAAQQGGQ